MGTSWPQKTLAYILFSLHSISQTHFKVAAKTCMYVIYRGVYVWVRVSLAHEMNMNMYVCIYLYYIYIYTHECACLLFIFWHNCDFALFHIEFVPQHLRPYCSFSIMAGQGKGRGKEGTVLYIHFWELSLRKRYTLCTFELLIKGITT